MMNNKDFELFARGTGKIGSCTLADYRSAINCSINPSIIEERRLNVASMDVFSRLMMDRIIFLGVGIDDDVANIIQAQLLYLSSSDPKTDIRLYINSPGGVVSAGLAIYDTMNIISPDVATICTGQAASMSAVLLSSGAKGKRSILPHSRVMIHQPSGGVKGQASDILIAAREIEKCREELSLILSENTGKELDFILKDIDRDNWMTAPEAVEYGMVDNIIKRSK